MKSIGKTLVSEGAGGVYGERMLEGCRVWDPYRSKLSALWYLDKSTDLKADDVVLYLGAANGTTVSHVADYVEAVTKGPHPSAIEIIILHSMAIFVCRQLLQPWHRVARYCRRRENLHTLRQPHHHTIRHRILGVDNKRNFHRTVAKSEIYRGLHSLHIME